MYRPAPTTMKCSCCGKIVKIDRSKVFLSYPPCYHWECPECGSEGYTSFDESSTTPSYSSAIRIPEAVIDDTPGPKFIQPGWECPKCGAILAPHQDYCPFCSRNEGNWITTVGTGTQSFYTNPNSNESISAGDINLPKGNTLTFTQTGDFTNVK